MTSTLLKTSLLFTFFSSILLSFTLCLEFDVGDDHGWVVPSPNNSQMYNQWASKNRFNVGDVVIFKYKKDSVMAVTKEEYQKCKSVRPSFFSNNGNSEYRFNSSGTFYFISGAAGHCERGQKMIIRVISRSDAPATSPPAPDSSDSSKVVSVFVVVVALQVIAALLGF